VDASRPTICKTRILAHDSSIVQQQVVRMDRLSRQPVDDSIFCQLSDYLEKTTDQVDAILISDYKSGVVSPRMAQLCHDLTDSRGKLLTVDSQGDLHQFKGFGLVKCNQAEAEASLGHPLENDEQFEAACRQLLDDLGACVVVITRGGNGMSMMQNGGKHIHISVANRSEVFDVTGAGDTSIAVLTLAMAAGARPVTAAHLANYAAGLVVRKIGNATTTVEELREAITSSQFPRVDPEMDLTPQ
ncbi:MAG TPA: PfkB family carbohydrate kinase, partial [Chloroflexota bacterium]|nr:PfkB family carbohydrate kinase [Chloroflexota bacterium]